MRLLRKIRNFGLPPYPALVLMSLLFLGLAEVLFRELVWAGYGIVFLVSAILLGFSPVSREEFLLLLLGNRRLRQLRLMENLLISFPFLLVLTIHHAHKESILLLLLSSALSAIKLKTNYSIVIPAPFPPQVFEFRSGFRKTFFLLPLFILLAPIAVISDNFNLGLLGMGLTTLVILGYYQKPEGEFLVWVHADHPASFLAKKIRLALLCSCFVLFIPSLILLIFFPTQLSSLLSFYALSLIFICTIIFIKYAAFPSEANLPEFLLLGLCLYFPPALFAVIPFFFFKSIRNLKPLLHD